MTPTVTLPTSAILGVLDEAEESLELAKRARAEADGRKGEPVYIEKVARASRAAVEEAVDTLIKRGFADKEDRDVIVQGLIDEGPDAILETLTKVASSAMHPNVFQTRSEGDLVDGPADKPGGTSNGSTSPWRAALDKYNRDH